MKLILILFPIFFILSSCWTSLPFSSRVNAVDPSTLSIKLPNLSTEPLLAADAMNKNYFQSAYSDLTSTQLDSKWKSANKDPMSLIRSYVNIWYDEAGQVSNWGPIGPCFGDPHIENFGFLWFDDEAWRYTYNDLDDVGACPVIFDAVRFFTTLKLFVNDVDAEKRILTTYIDTLNGKAFSELPSSNLTPDFNKVSDKQIKQNTADGRLVLEKDGQLLTSLEQEEVFAALKQVLRTPDELSFIDIYRFDHTAGGSAGLDRYKVLAKDPAGDLLVLELKELGKPAAERGPWSTTSMLNRQQFMEKLWGANKPMYLRFPIIGNKPFLLRSTIKKSVDFSKLSDSEKIGLLSEEAYIMAKLHKQTLVGTAELADWLLLQSKFMADRYTTALENLN